MKKVTISLPEKMVKEVDDLAAFMEKEEFWTKAITWRNVISKGLAYFKEMETKSPSIKKKI